MAHAEKNVIINRPVESVFDFVLNGANNKLWRSSVLDIRPLDAAPYGVGSRFEQGLKGPGGRIAGDYEITEMKPNELIQFQVIAGPARPMGIYRFQRQGGRAALTFVLDYHPKAPPRQVSQGSSNQDIARKTFPGEGALRKIVFSITSKLMDPMIQRSMEQEVGMLDELKAFLEKHV